MNCLLSLERWDLRFDSHWRHRYMCDITKIMTLFNICKLLTASVTIPRRNCYGFREGIVSDPVNRYATEFPVHNVHENKTWRVNTLQICKTTHNNSMRLCMPHWEMRLWANVEAPGQEWQMVQYGWAHKRKMCVCFLEMWPGFRFRKWSSK
jgi:hypothetical protein